MHLLENFTVTFDNHIKSWNFRDLSLSPHPHYAEDIALKPSN